MNASICDREAESLAAVQSGGWPEACDADLRRHVSGCAVCANLILVVGSLQDSNRPSAMAEDRALPPAGLLWWKAQLRARREAVELASEPVALCERIAYALGSLVLIALAIWRHAPLEKWLAGLADAARTSTSLYLHQISVAAPSLAPWTTEWMSAVTVAACSMLVIVALCVMLPEE